MLQYTEHLHPFIEIHTPFELAVMSCPDSMCILCETQTGTFVETQVSHAHSHPHLLRHHCSKAGVQPGWGARSSQGTYTSGNVETRSFVFGRLWTNEENWSNLRKLTRHGENVQS